MKTTSQQKIAPCSQCQVSHNVQLRNINDKLYWFFCSGCDQTSEPATNYESAHKQWNMLQKRVKK